jgi:hypothetical protein
VDHSTGSIAGISPSPSRRMENWISLSKKLSQPRIAYCLALFHETCPSTGMLVAEGRIDATYLQQHPHTSAAFTSQQCSNAYRDESYPTRKRYTNQNRCGTTIGNYQRIQCFWNISGTSIIWREQTISFF